MKRTLAVLIVFGLAAVLSGCGDGDSATANTTTAPPTGETQTNGGTITELPRHCPPGASPAVTSPSTTKAGTANRGESLKSYACIDGEEAIAEEAIYVGSEIETADSGSIGFTVAKGQVDCLTYHNSLLEVQPDERVAVKWLGASGASMCAVGPGARQAFAVGEVVGITVHDPIFGVTIDGDTITIKVVHGTADVTVTGSEPFSLKASEQRQIKAGKVGTLQKLALSEEERQAVEQLQDVAPLPDLTIEDVSTTYLIGEESCQVNYTLRNLAKESPSRDSIVRVTVDRRTAEQPAPAVSEEPIKLQTIVPLAFCNDTHFWRAEVEADIEDVVAESREDNNTVSLP